MVVESVRVHMLSSQHVVILKESDRERYLPIWIGPSEANAIAMRLQGLNAERPLTHDLLVSIVAGCCRDGLCSALPSEHNEDDRSTYDDHGDGKEEKAF